MHGGFYLNRYEAILRKLYHEFHISITVITPQEIARKRVILEFRGKTRYYVYMRDCDIFGNIGTNFTNFIFFKHLYAHIYNIYTWQKPTVQ